MLFAILRAPFLSLAMVLWTFVCCMMTFFMALVLRWPRQTVMEVLQRVWAQTVLWFSFVDVRLIGEHHVPKEGRGFLYVFNHTSYYDIFVLFGYAPRPFFFGAKSELFSIPFFGATIRMLGVLPIARAQRQKVFQVYKEAEQRVEQGDSFALAPEGTRQTLKNDLGEFKSGPFYFAINAHMSILPVVMRGCEKVLPKKSIWVNAGQWRQTVELEFLPPVDTTGLTEEDIPQLKDKIREMMRARLSINATRNDSRIS